MKIEFKLNKEYEFSTVRTAYINGKDTGYSIKTCIRPKLYSVYKNSISETGANFISLQQAKEYVIEQLQKEGN